MQEQPSAVKGLDSSWGSFAAVANAPHSGRPARIVVRLRNRQTKEAFLSAIKNCNSSANEANRLTTASIGLPGTTQRIFITDHLSPRNKRLLGLVKEAAREKQYAYVWVKNSKLLHTD